MKTVLAASFLLLTSLTSGAFAYEIKPFTCTIGPHSARIGIQYGTDSYDIMPAYGSSNERINLACTELRDGLNDAFDVLANNGSSYDVYRFFAAVEFSCEQEGNAIAVIEMNNGSKKIAYYLFGKYIRETEKSRVCNFYANRLNLMKSEFLAPHSHYQVTE